MIKIKKDLMSHAPPINILKKESAELNLEPHNGVRPELH